MSVWRSRRFMRSNVKDCCERCLREPCYCPLKGVMNVILWTNKQWFTSNEPSRQMFSPSSHRKENFCFDTHLQHFFLCSFKTKFQIIALNILWVWIYRHVNIPSRELESFNSVNLTLFHDTTPPKQFMIWILEKQCKRWYSGSHRC